LTAGIVTLVVFLAYTQIENHILNPVVMSRTVSVNPLLVLLSILVGASLGSWLGGTFGAFVAALIAIPTAGALQVVTREIWRATAPQPLVLPGGPGPAEPAGVAVPPSRISPPGSTDPADPPAQAGADGAKDDRAEG
jgi:hypothetical protein